MPTPRPQIALLAALLTAPAASADVIDFENFATPNTCVNYFDNFGVMPSSFGAFS